MGNGSRSYIYLQYANDVGNIPGAVVFYVDEPEWETKVIGQNIDWTPFLWRTSDGEQSIYFSCSLGLFDGDGRTLDELVRLALLISYWEATDTEALSSLLNEDYYFIPWFIGELIDERGGFDNYCSVTKAQSPRGSDEWDFCNWYASPLLVLTDEWFYQMFDDNWSTYKRSDYFDHIMLWVSPQAPNVDIEVSWLRIRLNGRVILDYQSATAPLLFSGNSPLYLSEYIKDCRKQYLSPTLLVNGICSLPSSGSPPLFAKILEEASKDYGQGWDYRYASHWCKDCEDAVDPIWPPLPNTWCTEYACYLMSKHINLYPKCTDIFDDPHNLGVPDMWWYLWLLGQLLHQTYRISPFDKVCPWQGCPYWSWDMLADAIGSGYYVGYHFTGGGGEKHWHSTLFIDWVDGMSPDDSDCYARFYAIGGNQSNGRVSVDTFDMINKVEDCLEQSGVEYEFLWGNDYNLFGKTN